MSTLAASAHILIGANVAPALAGLKTTQAALATTGKSGSRMATALAASAKVAASGTAPLRRPASTSGCGLYRMTAAGLAARAACSSPRLVLTVPVPSRIEASSSTCPGTRIRRPVGRPAGKPAPPILYFDSPSRVIRAIRRATRWRASSGKSVAAVISCSNLLGRVGS